jgi:hypothetical protein
MVMRLFLCVSIFFGLGIAANNATAAGLAHIASAKTEPQYFLELRDYQRLNGAQRASYISVVRTAFANFERKQLEGVGYARLPNSWLLFGFDSAYAADASTCLIGGQERPLVGGKCSTKGNQCSGTTTGAATGIAGDTFKCGGVFGGACVERTPVGSISKRCLDLAEKSVPVPALEFPKFIHAANDIKQKHCSDNGGRAGSAACKALIERMATAKDHYKKASGSPLATAPKVIELTLTPDPNPNPFNSAQDSAPAPMPAPDAPAATENRNNAAAPAVAAGAGPVGESPEAVCATKEKEFGSGETKSIADINAVGEVNRDGMTQFASRCHEGDVWQGKIAALNVEYRCSEESEKLPNGKPCSYNIFPMSFNMSGNSGKLVYIDQDGVESTMQIEKKTDTTFEVIHQTTDISAKITGIKTIAPCRAVNLANVPAVYATRPQCYVIDRYKELDSAAAASEGRKVPLTRGVKTVN